MPSGVQRYPEVSRGALRCPVSRQPAALTVEGGAGGGGDGDGAVLPLCDAADRMLQVDPMPPHPVGQQLTDLLRAALRHTGTAPSYRSVTATPVISTTTGTTETLC